MTDLHGRRSFVVAMCAVAAPWATRAQEQSHEGPPLVRIIVPFSAGNALDVAARAMAQSLQLVTGRQHIVDNRAGGNSIIGSAEVSRAKPDGSFVLYSTGGHTTNAALLDKLPYDSVHDFTPITQVWSSPGFALLVREASPYRTVDQLIAAAKADPGKVSFGSAGTGNTTHIIGAMFGRAAGVELLHVPYKGSALNDLMGGHVDMTFISAALARPLIEGKRVRALAISGDEKLPDMPDIPTFAEIGFKGADVPAWGGIWGPKGMSGAVAHRIQRDVAAASQRPEYIAATQTLGFKTLASTPEAFDRYVQSEIARYQRELPSLNIHIE